MGSAAMGLLFLGFTVSKNMTFPNCNNNYHWEVYFSLGNIKSDYTHTTFPKKREFCTAKQLVNQMNRSLQIGRKHSEVMFHIQAQYLKYIKNSHHTL